VEITFNKIGPVCSNVPVFKLESKYFLAAAETNILKGGVKLHIASVLSISIPIQENTGNFVPMIPQLN